MPCSNMIIFYLLVFTAFFTLRVLITARAETYTVGDTDGWTLFTESSNWTKGKQFHVGDVLIFQYNEGLHNVVQVNATAYEHCIKDPNLKSFASGNDSLVLKETGQVQFICTITDHCEHGQKLRINVVK
ncbi:hypothetical protein ACFE04_009661 [Oxalis oulophora]